MQLRGKNLFSLFVLFVSLQTNYCVANEKEKQAVIDQKIKLNTLLVVKDAAQLVEDIAYPEETRLKVYLSHSIGKYFSLNKVTVIIDGVDKSMFSYNVRQREALLRGGSNRIYISSVVEGIHELVAVFEGKDRGGNIIKQAKTWLFDKKNKEMIVVIKVSDNEKIIRPSFEYSIVKGE